MAPGPTGGYTLMAWWGAVLILLPFVPWAWLVSSVFDKHAGRFFLGKEKWAAIHSVFGLAALAAGFLMPVPSNFTFLLGFVAVLAILSADVALFVVVANKDEQVPERAKLRLDLSKFKEASKAKAEAKKQGTVSLDIVTSAKQKLAPPAKDTPEYETRVAAEGLVIGAIDARAGRVEIGPGGRDGVYAVSMTVDGVKQAGEQLAVKQAVALMDFWKSCAGLDVSDRRKRLTGDCTAARFDRPMKLRVISQGVTAPGGGGGMRVQLLLDPEGRVNRTFEDLGLAPAQAEAFRGLGEKGLVLLGAGREQGATTTLYTMARTHDAYTKNVQVIESEPQATLEGVRQTKFEAGNAGVEYSTAVRTILRRDPDVVAVGELVDQATAQEIARADLERSRVYLSLRAESALACVQTYVKAVGDADQAAKGLAGATAQKLVRALCTNCRVAYQPPASMVQKMGLSPDKVKQLFKKGGQVLIKNKPETCPVCGGSGYFGQVGVFELFPIGPEERAAIREQDWPGLRGAWKKRGLPTLQQAALRKAVEGVTSVEEVTRVVMPPEKPKAGSGGAGSGGAPKTDGGGDAAPEDVATAAG